VFYWAALSGDGNTRADNIMKHGANNILILFDVLLSRNPFLSYHFWVGTARQTQRAPLEDMTQISHPQLPLYCAHQRSCQSYRAAVAAAQVSLLYGTLYLIFMWAVWLPAEDYWVSCGWCDASPDCHAAQQRQQYTPCTHDCYTLPGVGPTLASLHLMQVYSVFDWGEWRAIGAYAGAVGPRDHCCLLCAAFVLSCAS
jgi:hypothetical protein